MAFQRQALQKGMDGVAVVNLQKNLYQLGVRPMSVDGQFGLQTDSAVRAFQQAHGVKADGIVGEETQGAIAHALIGQIPAPADGPSPWMQWMKAHLGLVEKTGSEPTAFDEEVFSHTSYGNLNGVMEPSCAATVSAALEETGYKSEHNAAAESYRSFGTPCDLKPGAIVGFNWQGKPDERADHVTFCDHIIDGKYVACLGGNQSHQVGVAQYSRSNIAFVRWPLEKLTK